MTINTQGRAQWYAPDGEQRIFEDGEEVPKGWRDHPFDKPAEETAEEAGLVRRLATIQELRAEYKRVLGKRPFSGWRAEQLKEKIAAA